MSIENDNCPHCENGHTPAGWALRKIANLLMIAGEDASRKRQPHPWLLAVGIKNLSPDMEELASSLAGRSVSRPGGADALDAWETVKKIVAAAGLPPTWGVCAFCNGSGEISSTTANNAGV